MFCSCDAKDNYVLKLLPSLQGKFIRINFDVTGYIVGANIETCILDMGFVRLKR